MKNSAIPNAFAFSRPYLEQSPDSTFIGWHNSVRYEIYDDNDNPLWATHPKHGGAVDIAVFRTDIKPKDKLLTVNKALLQAGEDREFELKPSLDVFILGFPQGIAVGRHLPVWKRATIASEPFMDVNGLPAILVDSATREGMSGSPVFAQRSGLWSPMGAKGLRDSIIGTGRMFLGVYSGRLGHDEFRAQLGIVWKKESLVEIFDSIAV